MFRRRSAAADPVDEVVEQADPAASGQPAPTDGRVGPWDVDEVQERGRRIDLGALWLPPREGMELRMEVDRATKVVSAASVTLAESTLQLQVFAAPRSAGIWDDIRAEIAASVAKQGGSADDLPGPFGRELLARMPVRTAEGRSGHRPARFIGHDGPRWFLRGVLTGRAAVDPEQAVALEEVFGDVVVVRGQAPKVPRDLLPLTMPGARPAAQAPAAAAASLDPFARGPEITEVH